MPEYSSYFKFGRRGHAPKERARNRSNPLCRTTSFFITEGGTRRPRPAGGAVGAPLPRASPATACRSYQGSGTDFRTVGLVRGRTAGGDRLGAVSRAPTA